MFALVALSMVLLAPGAAPARASEGCASASASSAHDVRACALAQRHSSRNSRSKKHHAKKRSKKATKPVKHPSAATPAGPLAQGTPLCEDGSAPIQLGRGSYSCADESEPACENGAEPTLSASNGSLICPAVVAEGSSSGGPLCEDESAPVRAGSGSYSCDDGSEAECENGSEPTLSPGGSALVCNPEAPEPSSSEEFESDGASTLVWSAS